MQPDNAIRSVLVVGDDTYPWYAAAWHKALDELGVCTRFFSYSRLWSPAIIGRIERRYLWGPAITRINRALQSVASEFEPDVILLYAALPIQPNTIAQLANQAWVTTYHNDDPFGAYSNKALWRFFRAGLQLANSHHVYRKINVDDYQRIGIECVAELRSYYVPWLDQLPELSPSDWERFGHDVVFVGHIEADTRISYLESLVSTKMPLKVYGTGPWRSLLSPEVYRAICPIKPVVSTDYRKVLAASKICLAFFSQANRDLYTRRVFEIPAVGGFLMAERTPVMQELYTEDKEAVYFASNDELVDKCQYYLVHHDARKQIARAGRARCLNSGYDVKSRVQQWLADTQHWIKSTHL
jgi:spore maturation protein CgeB